MKERYSATHHSDKNGSFSPNGDLVLHPAPGEMFNVTVDVTDELLNSVKSDVVVFVQVSLSTKPAVFQQTGEQIHYNKSHSRS